MTKLKLYSHPRSGTNWTLALLEMAYWGCVKYHMARTGHWSKRVGVAAPESKMLGGHQFYNAKLPGKRVYLYRDGRDVALSLWNAKAFQPAYKRGMSFSEFIRTPLDWRGTPGVKAKPRRNIIQHWKLHLDSWHNAPDTLLIRYEDLLSDIDGTLAQVAEFTGDELLPVDGYDIGAGPFPSGDYRIAKWQGAYSDADTDYFNSIVPSDYWGLWNG